ncbi:DNA invertase Pin-like site-specific DNA recombinase [Micromonospora profundi]|uniref:recombinase family protein n=1 Tax=Micromonospora profundi TaxID=1420889 RepID=UPI0016A039F6|nr:recombinase family protein [Micromonospora profundi]NJC10603.1 DNA invertase Pin-like site-specific DNA recombinase [Micromonospora profundi]
MNAVKPGLRAIVNAVIYARVSEDDKKQRRSVGEQEQECRDAATEQTWSVAKVFVDNDRSASRYARKTREEYVKLLDYLATAHVDVLVMWESSRGGRELEGWAGLLNLCRRRGVRIHVVTHHRTYDLDNPRDWRTLAEDGVDSAYESEKTRERILRSVRAKAASGKPHGKLLYGYRRTYDDRGNFIAQVPHDEHAAVVQEAAKRVAAGEASYSIAQDFNARGIPTPRGGSTGWSLSQIGRMLKNPGYNGKRVHLGKIVGDADWPAIIDDETYALCRSILTDPKRKTQRDTAVRHLLSGAAVCDLCGGRMRVQKNRTHLAYVCHGRFCVSVKTTVLEQFVVAVLMARLSRPDALDLLSPERDASSRQQAEQEARRKRERLDEWYAAAARDEISPAGLATIERKLLAEIEDAESRAQHVDVPPLVRDLVGPDPEQKWERLTIGQQREVVSLLLDLRVGKTYQGARSLDPARLGNSRWRGDSQTWAERGLV